MERTLMRDLVTWRTSRRRKPLLLMGVRQCGKTWLLKEFARRCYANLAYVNFDETPDLADLFAATKDTGRLIPNLALALGQRIDPGETLLVLDEIQGCPVALNALKYFHENASEYHVAAAGSLLGVELAGSSPRSVRPRGDASDSVQSPGSFPVGQVDFLDLAPMTFTEFLLATGDGNLVDYMASIDRLDTVPRPFATPLTEKLRIYFATGGMPEVVARWADGHDPQEIDDVLAALLRAYEGDFAKHAAPVDYPKISMIWNSLPSQLSRENRKFLYSAVKPGARAREYEDALRWLVGAGLITQVFRATKPGLPLSAYDDLSAFKLYLADIGVLRRLARLPASAFAEPNPAFTEFRGAFMENYVLTALARQFDGTPRYWSQLNPSYEVDFLIQRGTDIISVEVKSGTHVTGRSLTKYGQKYAETTPLRLRLSAENLTLDDNLLNIPLYLADRARDLIGLAMDTPEFGRTSRIG